MEGDTSQRLAAAGSHDPHFKGKKQCCWSPRARITGRSLESPRPLLEKLKLRKRGIFRQTCPLPSSAETEGGYPLAFLSPSSDPKG